MVLKVFKKGFNYSQDGQGNRLVYHLQGCNLRCPWCSNPEGLDPYGVYITDARGIKSFSCFTLDIADIVKEAIDSKTLFFDGGGVTFSGGEATIQFTALREALRLLKENGIHTAIETNGTHAKLSELFSLIDQLIIDFKHYSDEKSRAVLGAGNETLKENLAKAFRLHDNVLVRTPLTNGFNAAESDIEGFLSFYAQNDCKNAEFELLQYHEYGITKWHNTGQIYTVKDGYIAEGIREKFERAYRGAGLKVVRS